MENTMENGNGKKRKWKEKHIKT